MSLYQLILACSILGVGVFPIGQFNPFPPGFNQFPPGFNPFQSPGFFNPAAKAVQGFFNPPAAAAPQGFFNPAAKAVQGFFNPTAAAAPQVFHYHQTFYPDGHGGYYEAQPQAPSSAMKNLRMYANILKSLLPRNFSTLNDKANTPEAPGSPFPFMDLPDTPGNN
nr:uncharacterized protein LOC107444692 isoform X1 [Parasteatoda tepidariorum]